MLILISQTPRLLGIFLVFPLFPGTHLVATTRFQPRPGAVSQSLVEPGFIPPIGTGRR